MFLKKVTDMINKITQFFSLFISIINTKLFISLFNSLTKFETNHSYKQKKINKKIDFY